MSTAVQVGVLAVVAIIALVVLGSVVSAAWAILKAVLIIVGALTVASWVFKLARSDT